MIELNQLSENTDPNWYKSTRIFLTNTGKPIHSSILSKSLQRANKRLKKPIPKHLSSHIFRHTTIGILVENKIPLKTIMDRVGHSDSDGTNSIYTHVTKNMKDEAINVLDKVMKNIFSKVLPPKYKNSPSDKIRGARNVVKSTAELLNFKVRDKIVH